MGNFESLNSEFFHHKQPQDLLVMHLVDALCGQDDMVRPDAARGLAKIGEPAIESLITCLSHPNYLVRLNAADVMGDMKSKRVVEALIKASQDTHPAVSSIAARSLAKTRDPRAISSLISNLDNPKDHVRWSAAEALGLLANRQAVKPLIKALQDANEVVRRYAAEALGRLGDMCAVEPLILALPRATGWWELENITVALGVLGDKRAVEPLIQVIEKCPIAANALARIGDTSAVEPLIHALSSSKAGVRYYAAQALGMLADPRALSELEQVAKKDTATIEVHHRDVSIADMAREAIEEIHSSKKRKGLR